MSVFSMAGSNPALPTYPLQRSVRLRLSAGGYFNRTPATATNRRTFTWSGWVKRGILGTISGTAMDMFGIRIDSNNQFRLYFNTSDQIDVYSQVSAAIGGRLITNAVYRDPSAWYHIVLTVDTTNATAGDRMRLYINGVEVTSFNTDTQPSLNYDTYVNTVNTHYMGYFSAAAFDGYLAEVNFIDGQALTPSSFGAYNSYGVWSPAKYTGTYGTNGFYLNFQDNSALTTTANIGIGKDSSGNGNYWTSNNISITAGATYDSMLDVPTLTSNTNANYAVLNPLANAAVPTLTNGNLFLTTPTTQTGNAFSTMGVSSGNYYFEVTVGSVTGGLAIGVSDSITQTTFIGNTATSWSYFSTGQKYNNGTATAYGASYTTNDVISVILNMDTGTLTFQKNSISQGQAFSGLTGTLFFAIGDGSSSLSCSAYVNFGQQPFVYPPGAAYKTLNTYNLPDSIVPVGAQYMAATTYTGNGSTQSIVNTVNGKSFQPDLVWYKRRNTADNHRLFDAVRGATKSLFSDLTLAESTESGVTSFNTSGFTLGLAGNESSNTYVGWQWRASNASAVSNTNGALTSQVSVNQTAGFSIVTWTGNGTGGTTVGHGLSALPQFVVIKKRSTTGDWYTASYAAQGLNYAYHLFLNTTGALSGSNDPYYMGTQTSLTSNVLSLAAGNPNNGGNENGTTYVAYCWTPVPGFSKFGSYTGNGSTDGPFTYLGFRPRWIMIKRTDSAGYGWNIYDTARSTYNIAQQFLQANSSNAETNNSAYAFDLLSNGFKLRQTDALINASGGTYIYAAFAENPFKNALAR